MVKCKSWQQLHKIISKNKKHDFTNKMADIDLVYKWSEFKKIKGKTIGEVQKKTYKKLGVHPSFLAVAYRRDACGAEKYVKSKYRG